MLYLSRKEGQVIIIKGEGIYIEIETIELKGKTVKIGIKSPGNVSVFRGEIFERIIKENLEAKNSDNNFVKNIVAAGE